MIYLSGLLVSVFGMLSQRTASALGFFREPNPAEPTLWRQVLRWVGRLGMVIAFILWVWLVLSALTADNIIGRDGILGRILDTFDRLARQILELVGRLIPDVEVTL